VSVTVVFDSSATPADCWVWALVNYQYPTKGISETGIRLEGQRDVSFTFGWENVYLIPVFVTGFIVRLFYLGTTRVSVDVVVTSLANLVTLTGLGFLVTIAVIILKPVIISRFGYRKKQQED
jgi:membrane protease YdiL (CAAX protease family)